MVQLVHKVQWVLKVCRARKDPLARRAPKATRVRRDLPAHKGRKVPRATLARQDLKDRKVTLVLQDHRVIPAQPALQARKVKRAPPVPRVRKDHKD